MIIRRTGLFKQPAFPSLLVRITLAATLSHGGRYKHRKSGENQEEIAQNATRQGGSPGV
ncbi:MAG: hypothetical protein ABSA70_14245 [Terriglobia bacterium]